MGLNKKCAIIASLMFMLTGCTSTTPIVAAHPTELHPLGKYLYSVPNGGAEVRYIDFQSKFAVFVSFEINPADPSNLCYFIHEVHDMAYTREGNVITISSKSSDTSEWNPFVLHSNGTLSEDEVKVDGSILDEQYKPSNEDEEMAAVHEFYRWLGSTTECS